MGGGGGRRPPGYISLTSVSLGHNLRITALDSSICNQSIRSTLDGDIEMIK